MKNILYFVLYSLKIILHQRSAWWWTNMRGFYKKKTEGYSKLVRLVIMSLESSWGWVIFFFFFVKKVKKKKKGKIGNFERKNLFLTSHVCRSLAELKLCAGIAEKMKLEDQLQRYHCALFSGAQLFTRFMTVRAHLWSSLKKFFFSLFFSDEN